MRRHSLNGQFDSPVELLATLSHPAEHRLRERRPARVAERPKTVKTVDDQTRPFSAIDVHVCTDPKLK